MAETENTHDIAEKTDEGGVKTRTETTRTETTGSETRRVDVEGEPKQIQPDGR